ncbi:MAG: hypothetical protein Q8L08_05915 [Candidatus Nanopelagicaceae bacterium]|nr:hypothetical protein [Candidatus Nanopelagicaceae bacterium]
MRTATNSSQFTFGNNVRAIRNGHGISMIELANATGMRRPSIEAIEKERSTTLIERHDLPTMRRLFDD